MMAFELSYDILRASQLDRDLHLSEAGLRESEERMRLAVEGADFGIWIRDLARNEIWATDKWRAIIRFKQEERLELDSILQRIHAEDRDAIRSVLSKATDGDGSYEAEYRLVLASGDIRWIQSHGRVEFDGTGKPIVVRGLSIDITARKQAEEEKQLLQQEIAHAGRVSLMGQLAPRWPMRSISRSARFYATRRRRSFSCRIHRRISTKFALFLPIFARTTSARGASSTGCVGFSNDTISTSDHLMSASSSKTSLPSCNSMPWHDRFT